MTHIPVNKNLLHLNPYHSNKIHKSMWHQGLTFSGKDFLNLKKLDNYPDYARKYSPGDPTKYIDWTIYARSDQLIVREKQEYTCINVNIGIDFSQSMFWPNHSIQQHLARSLHQKIEIAFRILLNLAYQHLMIGNRVNLWLISTDTSNYYQPKSKEEIISFYYSIVQHNFSQESLTTLFHKKKYIHSNHHISYWIGDGLSNFHNNFLKNSQRSYFLQTLSSLETNVDWLKDKTYYFGNKHTKKEQEGSVLKRKNYLKKEIEKWQNNIKADLKKRQIHHIFLTDESLITFYIRSLISGT